MAIQYSPPRLYLASRSPRRRELLTQIGVTFDTLFFRSDTRADAEVDETPLPAENPRVYVERVARAKAEHGVRIVTQRRLRPQLVLAADTTLEFEGEVIGKPVDVQALPELTRDLLAFRSGASHQVPAVPFQLLGNETLSKEQWAAQAYNMGWQELRINLNTLERHGAVSEPTARAMAQGVLAHSQADWSLATTVIAGPTGGSPEKPVGTVCFAWAGREAGCEATTARFAGDREAVRAQAVAFVLEGLLARLDSGTCLA